MIYRSLLTLAGNDGSPSGSGGIYFPIVLVTYIIDLLTAISILQMHNRPLKKTQVSIERKMLQKKGTIDILPSLNNEESICEDIHEIKLILQRYTALQGNQSMIQE